MSNKVKCPICGTSFEDEGFEPCPKCGWVYDYDDYSDDDKDIADGLHHISFNEAKHLVANGKNIWGDPLPKNQ